MKITMEHNDYVLLKPYEIESQTSLIVNNNDTPCLGEVAVNYEIWGEEIVYTIGEILLFDVMKSQKIVVGGKEYIIVKTENIIAKVDLADGKKDIV